MTAADARRDRDTFVLRAHLAGASYRDIGTRLGLSVVGVHRIVKRQLQQLGVQRDDEGVLGATDLAHLRSTP